MRRDNPDANAAEVYQNLVKAGMFVVRVASASQKAAGVFDSFIALDGFWHHVEIKSAKGRLRESQINYAIGVKGRGCLHSGRSSWEIGMDLAECNERQRQRARKVP